MEQKCVERLMGRSCKVVMKAPDETRGKVRIGIIEEVICLEKSINIILKEGSDSVKLKNIIAIRPILEK